MAIPGRHLRHPEFAAPVCFSRFRPGDVPRPRWQSREWRRCPRCRELHQSDPDATHCAECQAALDQGELP